MINTDPEYNYWAWKWMHNGKECHTQQDFVNAWLSIDPFTDKTYYMRGYKYKNHRGSDLSRQVAKNIFCNHDEFKVTDKISLADYQDYAIKKFDSQMAKIAERGPLSISLSGGIDSTMVFAWAIKNKVDLKVFTWENDPWQGKVNTIMHQKILDMTKSVGIELDFFNWQDPEYDVDNWLKEFCDAEIFDIPMVHFVTTSGWMNMPARPSGWAKFYDRYANRINVTGQGTDELFLHRETTYVRLMPKDILTWIVHEKQPPLYMANQNYRIGGTWGDKWSDDIEVGQGKQVMIAYDDWGFLEHLGEEGGSKEEVKGGTWPGSSKEWVQAWHNIEPHSCTSEQFDDIINVGWLKDTIRKWTCDAVADNVHSVPCTEKYYTLKPDLKKYMVGQANKFYDIYQKRGITHEAFYWRQWSRTLQYFNQLPPDVLEHIHTMNWFLKNQKH